MIELIYASASTVPFPPAELATLLALARQRNAANNVSGVLLYHEGSFLQVLEGEAAQVDATYARIEKDPRHRNVLLLRRGEIAARRLGDWRMGFVASAPTSKAALDGFSDFLRGGALSLRGDAAATQRILDAFRDGRYHPSIR